MMARFTEKRKFPRIKSRFPLKYKDLRKIGGEFRGTVSKNISEGGVRFRSDRFISLACRLVVELNIATIEKPVRTISKIVWIKKLPVGDDYEVGSQFLEINRESKEFIRNLIEEELQSPSV